MSSQPTDPTSPPVPPASRALPDDVKELAGPVLAHRLVPTTDARIRGRAAEELLAEVIEQVEVPVEFETGMAQASE